LCPVGLDRLGDLLYLSRASIIPYIGSLITFETLDGVCWLKDDKFDLLYILFEISDDGIPDLDEIDGTPL